MRAGRWAALLWLLLPVLALAQTTETRPERPDKFRVAGDRVFYDIEHLVGGRADILDEDLVTLAALLRAHPEVRVLELNSGGGSVWAAQRMAQVVIDRGLDTHVTGICISSCVTVFLGGKTRTMADGARIGFHQTSWPSDSMARFFNDTHLRQQWDSPFDFAEWLYGNTQRDVYDRLVYMVSRGVDPRFAIETLRTDARKTWVPARGRLLAGGVLTE